MGDDEVLQLEVELIALHLVQDDLQEAINWRIRRLRYLYGEPLQYGDKITDRDETQC
jgi:hypothetical protein